MSRLVATLCGAFVLLLTALPEPAAASGPCFGIPSLLFLEGYPLAGTEAVHITSGYQNNVDPRLVAALAQTESSLGTKGDTCTNRYNAWGWINGGSCKQMGNWSNGVITVTAGLRTDFFNRYGISNLSQLQYRYCCGSCPGGPAQCGTAQCHEECRNWLSNTTDSYARKYHGDVNNLNYSWSCCGDCHNDNIAYPYPPGNNGVDITELLQEVAIRFGSPDTCPRGDIDGQAGMTVDELIYADADALGSAGGRAYYISTLCVAP
jgi:hypothetical protein